VAKRHARPPGSGRGPGRPKKAHVASSVERAREYLEERRSTEVIEGLLVAANKGMARTFVPVADRRRTLAAFRRLARLLPEFMSVELGELQARWEQSVRTKHHDPKTRLATFVLGVTRLADVAEPTPTELLAVAVAVGSERSRRNELEQAALLEAWKKRHRSARDRVKDLEPLPPPEPEPQPLDGRIMAEVMRRQFAGKVVGGR
jgi:hypothetical protein